MSIPFPFHLYVNEMPREPKIDHVTYSKHLQILGFLRISYQILQAREKMHYMTYTVVILYETSSLSLCTMDAHKMCIPHLRSKIIYFKKKKCISTVQQPLLFAL